MADKRNAKLVEQMRAKIHREASEEWIKLEQERLKKIFASLGNVETNRTRILFQGCGTLDEVRTSVEAGDRAAMLVLLDIVIDSLLVFEVLSEDVRKALADGVEQMRNNLGKSDDFLPRKPGQKATEKMEEFPIAFQVEALRYFQGKSREDAIAEVAADLEAREPLKSTINKEHLVLKRWKRHHKEARGVLESMSMVFNIVSNLTGMDIRKPQVKMKRATKRIR